MKQYHEQLKQILDRGEIRTDRTGVGTKSIFGMQARYDLRDGFPAVTTKRLAWRSVVAELLWFLEGSTDERRLAEIQYGTRDPSKTTIWTANADKQGVALGYRNDDQVKELGPVYGKQFRDAHGVDQLKKLIHDIRHNPLSRRHIINLWNVGEIDSMALPPCHMMMQYYVSNDGRLNGQMYQRSADMFLGVPFNIASESLLIHIIAQICGLKPGTFVHTIGDAHIYLNHLDQVQEQLSRTERDLPRLIMPNFKNIDELLQCQVEGFRLVGYDPHPTIRADMAV